ncbi:hypothetical protein U27_02492 [Candidatus Vecturithrix granuli]|uniref:Uncharacterized protein n=1 Tax=Vecturithrix granuli TaxID=1499967 RepID=A0A0S6WBE7_VECG1|nr:hypothetical protein U27_02492 [Candidatus Vecturithrix granuli]
MSVCSPGTVKRQGFHITRDNKSLLMSHPCSLKGVIMILRLPGAMKIRCTAKLQFRGRITGARNWSFALHFHRRLPASGRLRKSPAA